MAGISHGQQEAIVQLAQACASLSFLGSMVIVVAYVRFKQLRTYSFQLVVWLAVCDLAVNFTFFLGSPSDGSALCYGQGFLQKFFQVALIQWTILIAQSLLVVSSKTRTFDGTKRMPWNHLWAWGVSTLLAVAPLSTGDFGETESSFCGVDSGDSWGVGSLWRSIFYAMVFVSMVAIVWAYAEVVKNLNRAQKSAFRLSLHATTSRYEDGASSSKQPGGTPAVHPKKDSSASIKAGDNPDAQLPAPSLLQSVKPGGLYSARPGAVSGSIKEGAAAGAAATAAAPRKRPSKRDSLWRRIILGSIVEGDEAASLDLSRRQDVAPSSNHSSDSPNSVTRSHSNVSVRDWLWSASGDISIFDETESHGVSCGEEEEEEECKNALWLNGMATPTKRRLSSAVKSMDKPAAIPATPSPGRLPSSTEVGIGGSSAKGEVVAVVGGGGGAIFDSSSSFRRIPTMKLEGIFPKSRTTTEVKAPPSTAVLAAEPAKEEEAAADADATVASSHGNGDGNVNAPGSSHPSVNRAGSPTSDSLAAAKTARSSEGNSYSKSTNASTPTATTQMTPQRVTKSRFVDGVGRARGYVSRMSSLDMDYTGTASTTPMGVRGSGELQHLPKKHEPEKDMDRFISRIKWYPVIYVLTWMLPLISGIYTIAVGQSNANFWLVLLATFTSRLQGLLNFICYGLNDKLKQAWLQDFLYRRAVASCCRAVWCCCFGHCYRHEDGGSGGSSGDSDADRTRQTDDAARGSSASNSFADDDFADGMEKGTAGPEPAATAAADKAAVVSPPLTSATPPRAPRKSMAVEYATPHHGIRQSPPSLLAPTRPARPGRKASADRYISGRGGRGKRAAKLTAKSSAAAAAAAGVRRQRALVGRVRTGGRRRKRAPAASSVPANDTNGATPGGSTEKPPNQTDGGRKKRNNHGGRAEQNGGGGASGSRKRNGDAGAPGRSGALSPALPISISMPVTAATTAAAAAAASGKRSAKKATFRSRDSGYFGGRGSSDSFSLSSSDDDESDEGAKGPVGRVGPTSTP